MGLGQELKDDINEDETAEMGRTHGRLGLERLSDLGEVGEDTLKATTRP
jgi:hypothetical protein